MGFFLLLNTSKQIHGFGVLTVVDVAIFWDIVPCSRFHKALTALYPRRRQLQQRYGGTCSQQSVSNAQSLLTCNLRFQYSHYLPKNLSWTLINVSTLRLMLRRVLHLRFVTGRWSQVVANLEIIMVIYLKGTSRHSPTECEEFYENPTHNSLMPATVQQISL
jgi:hypothetical protein